MGVRFSYRKIDNKERTSRGNYNQSKYDGLSTSIEKNQEEGQNYQDLED